jgi:hypothetical protein
VFDSVGGHFEFTSLNWANKDQPGQLFLTISFHKNYYVFQRVKVKGRNIKQVDLTATVPGLGNIRIGQVRISTRKEILKKAPIYV